MFIYYLILRGDNSNLGKSEFEILWRTYFRERISLVCVEGFLYNFTTSKSCKDHRVFLERLVYTNHIGRLICEADNLENIELPEFEEASFCVRNKKPKNSAEVKYGEKEVGDLLWRFFKNPKVDLTDPELIVNKIEIGEKVILLEEIFTNKRKYLIRMPKNRPKTKPFTLKSDLARVCVNLLGLERGTILDPFCGTGALLLEGSAMGFKTIGNDVSKRELHFLKENFVHYNLELPQIFCEDSQTKFLEPETIDGIVTDVPYGRASKKVGRQLYENWIRQSYLVLKKNRRLVVIYANFTGFESYILSNQFKVVTKQEEYVNKSMIRCILVLEKI